jgi:hypothetical protein
MLEGEAMIFCTIPEIPNENKITDEMYNHICELLDISKNKFEKGYRNVHISDYVLKRMLDNAIERAVDIISKDEHYNNASFDRTMRVSFENTLYYAYWKEMGFQFPLYDGCLESRWK